MKRYIFNGVVKKRLVRHRDIPCTCGAKTKRVAFFDSSEVYLTGECTANENHETVEYPWPTIPEDRMLSPLDAELLGFEVHS